MISVKRSMSPDGRIDSVTVELQIEAEITDTQAVLDAISITDNYASAVIKRPTYDAAAGGEVTGTEITGMVQAVFPGEPSRSGSGKFGPGAVLVGGQKFKSFDKNLITKAQEIKTNGRNVHITFKRNEAFKSNDIVSLEGA